MGESLMYLWDMSNAQNTPGQMTLKDTFNNMASHDEAMDFFTHMDSNLQEQVACMADDCNDSDSFFTKMNKRIERRAKSEDAWKRIDAEILKEFLAMVKPWAAFHWNGTQYSIVSQVF